MSVYPKLKSAGDKLKGMFGGKKYRGGKRCGGATKKLKKLKKNKTKKHHKKGSKKHYKKH